MCLVRLVPRAIGHRFASKAPLTSCLATLIMAQMRPEWELAQSWCKHISSSSFALLYMLGKG